MSDYQRAYMFTNKSGTIEYLFEVRRGDEIRGADQGYVEAEWVMKVETTYEKDRVPDIIEYRANFGWGNGGPSISEWEDESAFDDEDFMTDSWVEKNYDVFSHPIVVRDFIMSRPGLYEQMYGPHGEYVPDNRRAPKGLDAI